MASDHHHHHQDMRSLNKKLEIQATATETMNKEEEEGLNAVEALERKEDPDPMELKTDKWYPKPISVIKNFLARLTNDQVKWISEARGQLIVVATIITTITFQIAVNPPSGVYSASFTDPTNSGTMDNVMANKHCQFSHFNRTCQIPGNAVLGYSNPVEFGVLTFFNTGAFTGSLCITFILVCGFPLIDPAVLTTFNLAVAATVWFLMLTFLLALDLTNSMLRLTLLGKLAMASSGADFAVFNIIVGLHLIGLVWFILTLPRYSDLAKPIKKFLACFPLPKQNGTNHPSSAHHI